MVRLAFAVAVHVTPGRADRRRSARGRRHGVPEQVPRPHPPHAAVGRRDPARQSCAEHDHRVLRSRRVSRSRSARRGRRVPRDSRALHERLRVEPRRHDAAAARGSRRPANAGAAEAHARERTSPRPIGPKPATEIVAVDDRRRGGDGEAGVLARGRRCAFASTSRSTATTRRLASASSSRAPTTSCCGRARRSSWTSRCRAKRAGTRGTYEWRLRADVGGGRYVLAIGTGDRSTGVYIPHSRMHYAGHFDVLPEPRRGIGMARARRRVPAALLNVDAARTG